MEARANLDPGIGALKLGNVTVPLYPSIQGLGLRPQEAQFAVGKRGEVVGSSGPFERGKGGGGRGSLRYKKGDGLRYQTRVDPSSELTPYRALG